MNHLINQMLSELIFFVSEKKEYLSYDCVLFIFQNESQKLNKKTTFNGGSLGSCIDEERSQLRYVMWIAEISESSNFWTQIALLGPPGSMSVWVSRTPMLGALIFSFGCRTIAGNEPYRGFWRRPSGPALILGGFQCGAARFVILLFSIAAALEWHTSETLGQPLASNALLKRSRVDVQGAAKPSSVLFGERGTLYNFDLRSVKTTRWI